VRPTHGQLCSIRLLVHSITSTSGEKGPRVKLQPSLMSDGASTDSTSLEYRKRPITGSRAKKLSQNVVEADSDVGSRTSAMNVKGIRVLVHEQVTINQRARAIDRRARAGTRT
jgi:hypothetical protein